MDSGKRWSIILLVAGMILAGPLLAGHDALADSGAGMETGPAGRVYEGFLYFPGSDGPCLKSVQRQFASGLSGHRLGVAVINGLIQAPRRAGTDPLFPADTRLRALFLAEDGSAYVDLAIPENYGRGVDARLEYLAVYAVVNSLTVNIPGIERVKILINGDEAQTLAGHMDLTGFYETNMLIVK